MASGGGGAVRILIVKDEPFIAMDLQSFLSDLGYEHIYHAGDISRAFELLDEINPDFAILDINVGHDLVFPFAAGLAARDVPFVFLTGLSREMLPAEWQGHPVLSKPFIRAALGAAMQQLNLSSTAITLPIAPLAGAEGLLPAEEGVSAPMLLEGDCGASPIHPTPSLPKEPRVQAPGEETLRAVCEPDPLANIADPSGGEVITNKPPSSD